MTSLVDLNGKARYLGEVVGSDLASLMVHNQAFISSMGLLHSDSCVYLRRYLYSFWRLFPCSSFVI